MRVEKDFEEFIELLNKHKVRYLIVGAYAVSFHARPRNTGDIDFLIEPTKDNANRLLRVLNDFGFGELDIKVEDICNRDSVIQLGYEPNRIDLIASINGVSFQRAYRSRVSGEFGKQTTWFISYEDLVRSKQRTGRKRDEADVELLKQFRKQRKSG